MAEQIPTWLVQVKGDVNGTNWEVSVVREDYRHGQLSWGWFDERKLLVSHNGGPCNWPLAPGLGPVMVEIANRLCTHLNQGRHPLLVNNLFVAETPQQGELTHATPDPRSRQ